MWRTLSCVRPYRPCATGGFPMLQRRFAMIMNAFNGRLMPSESKQLARLRQLGIGPSESAKGLLDVVDEAAFDAFFLRVASMTPAAREAELKDLPKRLVRSLGVLLDAHLKATFSANSAPTGSSPGHQLRMTLSNLNQLLMQSKATGTVSARLGAASTDQQAASQTTSAPAMQEDHAAMAGTVELNEGQRAVLEAALKGYNLYIGGSAGTGKTVLLEAIRTKLGSEKRLSVAMTATTGVAGCHIRGSTFHHAFGISRNELFSSHTPLMRYDVVIIDEVSMLSAKILSDFDAALRRVHHSNLPFAGLQLILCGDFLQLSAINGESVLHSPLFRQHFVHMRLTEQVRQSKSPEFAEMLETLRLGRVPQNLTTMIPNSVEPQLHSDAVNLLPTNKLVQAVNEKQLALIDGEEMRYAPLINTPTLLRNWGPSFVLQIVKSAATPPPQASEQQGDAAPAAVTAGKVNIGQFRGFVSDFLSKNFKGIGALRDDVWVYQVFDDAFAVRVAMDPMAQSVEQQMQRVGGRPPTDESLPSFTHPAGVSPELAALAAEYTRLFREAMRALEQHLRSDPEVRTSFGLKLVEVEEEGNGLHTSRDEELLHAMVTDHPVVETVGLKVGARVLLRANLSLRLVNGSIGTVVGFSPITTFMPYPLPTNHFSEQRVWENVVRYSQFVKTEALSSEREVLFPVVRFGDSHDSPTFVIPPWRFTVGGEASTNYYGVTAVCLPLSLAYAFTVHRVQGLTLVGRVHLELSQMWPCEHLLYVAMSRVRTPDQLTMSCFKDEMIVADQEAVAFDEAIPTIDNVTIAKHLRPATWRTVGDSVRLAKGKSSAVQLAATTSAARSGSKAQQQQLSKAARDVAKAMARMQEARNARHAAAASGAGGAKAVEGRQQSGPSV